MPLTTALQGHYVDAFNYCAMYKNAVSIPLINVVRERHVHAFIYCATRTRRPMPLITVLRGRHVHAFIFIVLLERGVQCL